MSDYARCVCVVLLVGCSPHRVDLQPAPPIAAAPSYGVLGGSRPASSEWWRDFGDPRLNQLVERALADNLQLAAMWARLAQAHAGTKGARSMLWPQAQIDLQASRQKQRFDLASIGEFTFENTLYSASVGATYELDLWNRWRSGAHAAAHDAIALRQDTESMAMSLVAEVVESWFHILAQRQQRRLLLAQVSLHETLEKLIELRFQQGAASVLDVYQQQQVVAGARARVVPVEASIDLFTTRLAVLLGAAPGTVPIPEGDELPRLPLLPAVGVPADLITQRPDLRALRERVIAADFRIAQAMAARLPQFLVSGALSTQDDSIASLIAAPLWRLLASLSQPLFDGGRRRADVAQKRAAVSERLQVFGDTYLGAIAEVESALRSERHYQRYVERLETQHQLALRALEESRSQYQQGLVDSYLQVISSVQAEQQSALLLLQARRQELSYRVQLLRALGGTWTQTLHPTSKRHSPSQRSPRSKDLHR